MFGGFAGGVLLGAVSDAAGYLHGPTVALTLIGPVCVIGGIMLLVGSRYVKRDITLVIEDVLERHAEGQRRQAEGGVPALQVHNLDFYYGANQVLFDVNLEVADGEIVALLGTNGAGKSTLLRAVAGLEHPHRGVIRIFGVTCTYLEPEQIIDQGVGPAGGRQDDLPRPDRAGQPAARGLLAAGAGSRRPGRRSTRPSTGSPNWPRRLAPAGRDTVRGRAADAGAGPGDDDRAQAAAHRRAGPRAGPQGGRPADGHRPRR